MIVVINHPTQGVYLAAKVAGPVFKEIADRVYAADLDVNQSSSPAHYVGNTQLTRNKKGQCKSA